MILGITGGVGAGKSSVLAILEKEYNAKLILADEVGRELMQPGEANYVNIVNAFGKEILNEDQKPGLIQKNWQQQHFQIRLRRFALMRLLIQM